MKINHQFKTVPTQISEELRKNGSMAANGTRRISPESTKRRAESLYMAFDQLKEGGFAIKNIHNIQQKHLQYLASRWELEGLSASTLQSRWSVLKVFFNRWLGKNGFVKPIENYLLDPSRAKRNYAATIDKSWSGKVSTQEMIDKIRAIDLHVGNQLLMMHGFGLRRKEAIMFRPQQDIFDNHIVLSAGTKGGRVRIVPILCQEQRDLLCYLRSICQFKWESLGNPKKTLKQNISRFNNLLRSVGINKKDSGVTSHGLRHEYVHDRYEQILQEPSPLRSGQPIRNKVKLLQAKQTIAAELGHGRTSITNSYFGKIRPAPRSVSQKIGPTNTKPLPEITSFNTNKVDNES